MKILKKGRVVEKRGGGGNEIHAPCACDGSVKMDEYKQTTDKSIASSTSVIFVRMKYLFVICLFFEKGINT